MGQDLLLGIDIGTYESKGVLTTPQGKVIAQATIAHKLLFPRAGWAEHDPELTWWGDFCNLSKQLLATDGVSPSDIKGVGVSAIGPDVLPIDENFNPLRNQQVQRFYGLRRTNLRSTKRPDGLLMQPLSLLLA